MADPRTGLTSSASIKWLRGLACVLALVASVEVRADLAAGSPVLMSGGSIQPIEVVAAGDALATPGTDRQAFVRVMTTLAHPHFGTMLVVETAAASLVVTSTQPLLLANGGWVRADQLTVAAVLQGPAGTTVPVTAISQSYRYGGANFNVWLEGDGAAFFAGGVAVGDYRRQVEMLADNQAQAPEPSGGCGTAGGSEPAGALAPVAALLLVMAMRRRMPS
ncbi:MAG: MYXO-CTERM sorting domain-containing protein [Deltaproteobacteria bacterium]